MLPKFPAYVGWRRKTKIAGSASISHSKLSSNSICALDPIGFGIYLAEFHTISHPKSNVTRLPCDWRIAVKYGVELLARTDLSVTPPGTEPVTKACCRAAISLSARINVLLGFEIHYIGNRTWAAVHRRHRTSNLTRKLAKWFRGGQARESLGV